MTVPVKDVSTLAGETVHDHAGRPIGKIIDVYAQEGDGEAAWVTIEATTAGLGKKKLVFIPFARLKHEGGDLTVPYRAQHIEATAATRRPRSGWRIPVAQRPGMSLSATRMTDSRWPGTPLRSRSTRAKGLQGPQRVLPALARSDACEVRSLGVVEDDAECRPLAGRDG
jgi:hypothetical protein